MEDINEISKYDMDLAVDLAIDLSHNDNNEGYFLYDMIKYDNVNLLSALVNKDIINDDISNIPYEDMDVICKYDSINILNYIWESIEIDPNFDYDISFKHAIDNNAVKVFDKLLKRYITNKQDLAFIGRDTIKYASKRCGLEIFQTLYKYGAHITQPIIYNYAVYYENHEVINYLDSFYIVRDHLDRDNSDDDDALYDEYKDCCGEHYYTSNLNDKNEKLLVSRTSNAIDIIMVLKRLPLPYELLEKIVIYTGDFYLMMAINQNLAKFMYFPQTYFRDKYDDEITKYSKKRFIKLIPDDNLITNLYEMMTLMIRRNNIPLFKFLHNIYTYVDIATNWRSRELASYLNIL